jgi:hypothetical protein
MTSLLGSFGLTMWASMKSLTAYAPIFARLVKAGKCDLRNSPQCWEFLRASVAITNPLFWGGIVLPAVSMLALSGYCLGKYFSSTETNK